MLSDSIKAHRTAKGLTQEELAIRLTPVSGIVTGISAGEATVSVTVGGVTDTCAFSVTGERYIGS